MGQRGKIRPRHAPRGRGDQIVRQPPAGIEGHPKAGDGAASQQSLEPEAGGQCPDLIHRRDQGGGIGLHQHQIGKAAQILRRHRAPAQPGLHIGMGLIKDGYSDYRVELGA